MNRKYDVSSFRITAHRFGVLPRRWSAHWLGMEMGHGMVLTMAGAQRAVLRSLAIAKAMEALRPVDGIRPAVTV